MEKWIEEFRQEIKQLINKWESVNTEHTNGWAYGATRVISKFNSAWAKHENENRSVTASEPAPPAESLHEMAKRMCEGRSCLDCSNGLGKGCRSGECLIARLYMTENTDDQLNILRKWASENPPKPVKTYRQDFFEKFPESPRLGNGYPFMPVHQVYCVGNGYYVRASETTKSEGELFEEAWGKPLGYWEA